MWLRLFLDPALAGLTVTVRQSPEPQNSHTGVHTGWNSWFAHWGVKMLEGTSEVGLYQTQGTLDAFISLQMKRQRWPALSLSS